MEKPFLCMFCSATFSHKVNCFRHERGCVYNDSAAKNAFKCHYCGMSFWRKDSFNSHLAKCFSLIQESSDLPDEESAKVEAPFKCRYCTSTFDEKISCTKHERFCISKPYSKYGHLMCHICGEKYYKEDTLDAHVQRCSSVTLECLSSSEQEVSVGGRKCPGTKTCECKSCPSTSNTNKSFNHDSCSQTSSESACGTSETFPKPLDREDLAVEKQLNTSLPNKAYNQSTFECECSDYLGKQKNKTNRQCIEKICSHKKRTRIVDRLPCLVEGCNLKFLQKRMLVKHLKVAHNGEIDYKETILKEFSSFQEFILWKEAEEENTFSYFRKITSDYYYYCQRSGKERKTQKEGSTRKANSKGKIKVGNKCTAQMKVQRLEDKVTVEYFPTHNHPCSLDDVKHQPLPTDVSQFINDQLVKEVSPTIIHAQVKEIFLRGNISDARKMKINNIAIKNIREKMRRLRMVKRLDSDDAKSVDLLVEQKKEEDSVLLYKPVGGRVVVGPEDIDHLPNADNLFMLGIQTQRQAQLMRELGTEVLVVDQAHGTNKLEYKLLTCLVVDSDRRGWPVAHLITSRTEPETLKYFFAALKNRLGEHRINCVITDHDMAIIDGMKAGLGNDVQQFFCQWKVINDFKEHLRQTVGKKLYRPIVEDLTAIVNEENRTRFDILVGNFVEYGNFENTKSFVDYFNKHYRNRPENWATCYRNSAHGEINTTNHVKSFHNALKKSYLQSRRIRLDDLVNILYKMEEDDHSARLKEQKVGFLTLPQPILERHEKGLTIPDKAVEQVLHNVYEIAPRSSDGKTRVLIKYNDICESDPCHWQCNNEQCLDLCSHMYSCDCPDRHPLCEHIHKLHSYITRLIPCIVEQDVPEVKNGKEEFHSVIVSKDVTEQDNDQEGMDLNAHFLTDILETVTVESEDPIPLPEVAKSQFKIKSDVTPTPVRKRKLPVENNPPSNSKATSSDLSKRGLVLIKPKIHQTEIVNQQNETKPDATTSPMKKPLLEEINSHLQYLKTFASSPAFQNVPDNFVVQMNSILSQAVGLVKGNDKAK